MLKQNRLVFSQGTQHNQEEDTVIVRMLRKNLLPLAFQSALAMAQTLSGTAQVYLNVTTGPTEYLASGILLGLPLNDTQIPDSLLSEFGFNKIRTGGSQLPAPSRGWTHGELTVSASDQWFLVLSTPTKLLGAV